MFDWPAAASSRAPKGPSLQSTSAHECCVAWACERSSCLTFSEKHLFRGRLELAGPSVPSMGTCITAPSICASCCSSNGKFVGSMSASAAICVALFLAASEAHAMIRSIAAALGSTDLSKSSIAVSARPALRRRFFKPPIVIPWRSPKSCKTSSTPAALESSASSISSTCATVAPSTLALRFSAPNCRDDRNAMTASASAAKGCPVVAPHSAADTGFAAAPASAFCFAVASASASASAFCFAVASASAFCFAAGHYSDYHHDYHHDGVRWCAVVCGSVRWCVVVCGGVRECAVVCGSVR